MVGEGVLLLLHGIILTRFLELGLVHAQFIIQLVVYYLLYNSGHHMRIGTYWPFYLRLYDPHTMTDMSLRAHGHSL